MRLKVLMVALASAAFSVTAADLAWRDITADSARPAADSQAVACSTAFDSTAWAFAAAWASVFDSIGETSLLSDGIDFTSEGAGMVIRIH